MIEMQRALASSDRVIAVLSKRLLEAALKALQTVLPRRSPDLGPTEEKLGLLLAELGQDADADQHLVAAMEIFRSTFGPHHPRTQLAEERFQRVLRDRSRRRRR